MRWKRNAGIALLGALPCLGLWVGCCQAPGLTLEHDGITRSYRLHVPATHDGLTPLPLLLVLHPFTGSGAGMERLTGFNELAEEEGFIVAYPDGLGRRWASGPGEDVDDLGFLLALIARISADHGIDESRVFATGASAGAVMAQYLACQSEALAGIGVVMGSQTRPNAQACPEGRPVPVLIIHGTADPIIPYAGGPTFAGPGRETDFLGAEENAAFWAARNACEEAPVADASGNGQTAVVRLAYPCPDGVPVELYRIEGGGHTWPGRWDWIPAFIVGPTAQNLDATRVIWQFFQESTPPAG